MANGVQGSRHFGRMMGVVVNQGDAPPRAQQFHPAVQPGKTVEARGNLPGRGAVGPSQARRRPGR